jgi:predicted flap endonuclease-1-like 5' DNA nuclease
MRPSSGDCERAQSHRFRDGLGTMPQRGARGGAAQRPAGPHMLIVFLIIVIALAALAGYYVGLRQRPAVGVAPPPSPPVASPSATPITTPDTEQRIDDAFGLEKARLIRSRDAEAAMLRNGLAARDAALGHRAEIARERERMFGELADARSETARYRQLVIDIETNAPPPILAGVGEPDDLKLIVGVGPVLERMLHYLGVTTFRQIARWTERDIAEFDAKLPEFPGRIQRDQWVTQARALHESKYGQGVPDLRTRG